MSEIMARELAALTLRDYVCAQCWGHLLEYLEPGGSRVECASYGAEHYGFVTKYYASTRQSDSVGEEWEVSAMLENIGIINNPHAGKSSNQILEELGF